MSKKIWLSSPHIGGNEQKYIKEAFDSNWIAPLGPNVDGFENDLALYCGIKSVTALSSGTAALHLALILLGVKHSDEVICQSFTFSATANPICYLGAIPVFIDSEPDTWNMCPQALEDAIIDRMENGKKPKAIILVHLYGMPAKIDQIMEIANNYEIPVIEDAAEALGSKYKDKACGTFGVMGILSFNGNKIITTSGGGALISNNKELTQKALFLATQARDNAPYYQHSQIGYNYRMSNIVAGIGRGQMEVLPNRVKKRREINKFYHSIFDSIDGIKFHDEPANDYFSNYWLTAILIDKARVRFDSTSLRLALAKKNIESRPLWKPMHLQPVFNNYSYYGSGISDSLFKDGLCLPSGSNLTESDLERIYNCIKKEMDKYA